MVLVVDSSVFIAGFHDRDVHHEEAATFLRLLADVPSAAIIIPILVPLETAHVLLHAGADPDIEDLFRFFEGMGAQISLDPLTVRFWIPKMARLSIKTHDAFIAAVAAEYRAALITLDRKLLRAYRAAGGIALLPREYTTHTVASLRREDREAFERGEGKKLRSLRELR